MQFKLNLNYLKALNFINAKKDVRYYLNGVYFEISEKGLSQLTDIEKQILEKYSKTI